MFSFILVYLVIGVFYVRWSLAGDFEKKVHDDMPEIPRGYFGSRERAVLALKAMMCLAWPYFLSFHFFPENDDES